MQKLIIKGNKTLSGTIKISGSKNATLPILASTILSDKKIEINNIPLVKDVITMTELLKYIGSNIKINLLKKKIIINNNEKFLKTLAPYSFLKTMRAGILVLGPLVSKYRKSICSFPGGCVLNGNSGRPINLHLNALKKLGMKYEIKKGYIHAKSKGKLKGNKIKFPKISVGASEQLITSAVLAKGKTVLSNLACEPEILDLTKFLISAGANIRWIAKRTCQIIGVSSLNETKYSVMADRIETGTFCVAATLTKGKQEVNSV